MALLQSIIIPLGIARYPYKRVILPLLLGNTVFVAIVSTLGAKGLIHIIGA